MYLFSSLFIRADWCEPVRGAHIRHASIQKPAMLPIATRDLPLAATEEKEEEYVFMYVCMYVCVYVCLYVCMYTLDRLSHVYKQMYVC